MARTFASAVIDAPAAKLWTVIRDFNNLPFWHQAIAYSRIENDEPADKIGCVRAMTLQDGGLIREKLLALSDYDYRVIYSILESPMGVENYEATLQLIPITDGDMSFVQWVAEFYCAPEREQDLVLHIGKNVFQAGFDNLKTLHLADS